MIIVKIIFSLIVKKMEFNLGKNNSIGSLFSIDTNTKLKLTE